MKFLLPEELETFSKVLRDFFEKEFPDPTVGFEEGLWRKAVELGLLQAALPEDGFGFLGASLCVEEAARALVPLPIFETLALALFPALCASEGDSELVEEITSGQVFFTGAFQELFTTEQEAAFDGKTLQGELNLVPQAPLARKLLVPAKTADGLKLYLVEGVTSEIQETLDLIRPYGRVTLREQPARCLGSDMELIKDGIRVLVSSELTGLARYALNLTLDYVKMRKQFSRPVGSFQALQHALADASMRVEQAAALTRFAAWAVDHDPEQRVEAALATKAFASEHVPAVIESCIQAHGGIGFTYEYRLHLYLRRARVLAMTYGDDTSTYQRLAPLQIA